MKKKREMVRRKTKRKKERKKNVDRSTKITPFHTGEHDAQDRASCSLVHRLESSANLKGKQ
jgi:hypothetical protein